MSTTKAFNAAIAIIEDRTQDAREMLREEKIPIGIGSLYARLTSAVDKTAQKRLLAMLHSILRSTIRLEPPDKTDRESYYEGVRNTEEIIEAIINTIEAE